MKKILFIAVTAFFFSCSNDSGFESKIDTLNLSDVTSKRLPCPPGTSESWSYDFDYVALHRASTDCTSRFSFCIHGEWVRDCLPYFNGKVSNYDAVTNKVSVVAVVLDDNRLELHFPIEIMSLPTFSKNDFDTFGFDSDYKIDDEVIIKTGEYLPKYTKEEIIVTVDLL
ncbi:hypothetical protein IP98_01806 [Flavobacterium cauense R2A-7]|uniref:Lipoprotein n=1 Tax=Flavobacterium cauense R2A-7 TaxID=1341154 RepID=A0A562LX47_9FLAO|nr:hypothetical protein [Flavobacterium cauense]KGO82746.1 hypothetical protein Q762_03035 [Flavobacterium cauense R2A-7]TWI12231.1 hypothetical protein IP98_01806 [Flavobacterium cauense R2A-7]